MLAVFLVLVFHPSPQINVGRDEKRAPLKTPAWEATKAARKLPSSMVFERYIEIALPDQRALKGPPNVLKF